MTRRIGTENKLAAALVLLILLPAIFYSAYELTTLTRSESLIAEVYNQQLDVVLFSLNQYAWDIANSWVNSVNASLRATSTSPGAYQHLLSRFLNENAGVQCLFVTDSMLTTAHPVFPDVIPTRPYTAFSLTASLRANGESIQQLYKLQSSGYQKIISVSVADSSGTQSLALMFAGSDGKDRRVVIGLVLDAERFIRDVLGGKMNEAAGDNFVLAVNKKGSSRFVFRTGDISPTETRVTKDLWLFPEYTIGIRLRGHTIDELVRERFYRNLLLIGLLDVILIAGAWFIYRTVRREVELAQLKADFVSNVSHELKTPLSLIRMFGETLQMQRVASEEKKQQYYDTIVQETERLTRLVNNILNFSRMEAGKKEYHFSDTDLNSIVGGVAKTYDSHLTQQGFEVATELHSQPLQIAADAEAASEALLNIIDNAVKYSGQKKYIRISTGRTQGTAYVEVQDHGIGIDPHHQKMIFEKFYRASSGLVHNTKGSGLGLTLVKHIMDAHKGEVSVKSEPGKGSSFRLSFPALNS